MTFEELISEMVSHDLDEARMDVLCRDSGFRVMNRQE